MRFDINARDDFYNTVAGDLLVGAVVTRGAAVTPPRGWSLVPGSDVSSSATQRLQVFYAIPVPLRKLGTLGRSAYRFTSTASQAMTGTLISVSGSSQARTVNAVGGAASATPSATVTAPSIAPTAATTRLLYVGAAGSEPSWTLPPGMTSIADSGSIGLAYQWWRTSTATGTRTATISTPAESIGELIALRFPRSTSCPKVRILNRRDGKRLRFKANADGVVAVRLKCRWTRRCVGAFGLMSPTPVAAGDFAVPAGATRTIRIPVCRRRTGCPYFVPGMLRGVHRLPVFIQVLLFAPNGQLVDVPLGRQRQGPLVLP